MSKKPNMPTADAFEKVMQHELAKVAVHYNVAILTASSNEERKELVNVTVNSAAYMIATALLSLGDHRQQALDGIVAELPDTISDMLASQIKVFADDMVPLPSKETLQ